MEFILLLLNHSYKHPYVGANDPVRIVPKKMMIDLLFTKAMSWIGSIFIFVGIGWFLLPDGLIDISFDEFFFVVLMFVGVCIMNISMSSIAEKIILFKHGIVAEAKITDSKIITVTLDDRPEDFYYCYALFLASDGNNYEVYRNTPYVNNTVVGNKLSVIYLSWKPMDAVLFDFLTWSEIRFIEETK